MDDLAGRVGILSLIPRPESEDINRALLDLGVRTVEIHRSDWGSGRGCPGNHPVVLLLGRIEYPGARVEAFLDALGNTSRIGIFERETFHRHTSVLRQCTDFQAWPCDRQELALRLRRAGVGSFAAAAREETRQLLKEFARLGLLGCSPVFVRVLELIKKLGRSDAPVLVRGDTGTGKELIARAIHYLGERHDRPFIPVNCGAIPDSLVENELFGHERGAFTDAKGARAGLVSQADGGTLFLDEVDALSAKAQVALLRFLEDYEVRPVGGTRTRKVDVRILAATNVDLQILADQGRFRQDLVFRLNILPVQLPTLAARAGDVEILTRHFLRRYGRRYDRRPPAIHPAALDWMTSYDWPGNVRELENLIHRAVVIAEGSMIHLRHLQPAAGAAAWQPEDEKSPDREESFNDAKARIIDRFEKRYLTRLLTATGGNVTQAAKRAGKERRALGKLLKKHGIRRDRFL